MNKLFSLRRFDGGEGTAPVESGNAEAQEATEGVGSQEEPKVLFGKQPEPAAAEQDAEENESEAEDRGSQYSKFKKEFKKEYQADLQRVIDKRFKNGKKTEAELEEARSENEKYNGLMAVLSKRYGTDDIEQLTDKLTADDGWMEEKALEEGLSLEAYKRLHDAEDKATKAQKQLDEINGQAVRDQALSVWQEQCEELLAVYPDTDIGAVLEDERMQQMMLQGYSVRDAFQMLHFDEIVGGVIKYTADKTKTAVAQAKAQRMARPAENGTRAGAAAIVKSDVEKLTKEDMEEIDKRVLRGEKISF